MLTSGDTERTQHIIDSLSLTGVSVDQDALTLVARVDIPDVPRATPSPEAVLTPEELARWQQAWQRWDP